jgi:hypothetical protein
MGAVIDKIRPSNSVNVQGLTVHIPESGYKPYFFSFYGGDHNKENRRLAKVSGVTACNLAWKRKGTRPEYVAKFGSSTPKHGAVLTVVKYPNSFPAGSFNDYDLDEVDVVGYAVYNKPEDKWYWLKLNGVNYAYFGDVNYDDLAYREDTFKDSDWQDYPEGGFAKAA